MISKTYFIILILLPVMVSGKDQLKTPENNLSTNNLENIKSVSKKVTGNLIEPYAISKGGKHNWVIIKYSLTTEEKRIKRPNVRVYRYIEDSMERRKLYGLTRGSKKAPKVDSALFNAKAFKSGKHRAVAYPEGKKLLLLRIELWHDGVLLDHVDTSTPSKLKLYNLPEEWWVN